MNNNTIHYAKPASLPALGPGVVPGHLKRPHALLEAAENGQTLHSTPWKISHRPEDLPRTAASVSPDKGIPMSNVLVVHAIMSMPFLGKDEHLRVTTGMALFSMRKVTSARAKQEGYVLTMPQMNELFRKTWSEHTASNTAGGGSVYARMQAHGEMAFSADSANGKALVERKALHSHRLMTRAGIESLISYYGVVRNDSGRSSNVPNLINTAVSGPFDDVLNVWGKVEHMHDLWFVARRAIDPQTNRPVQWQVTPWCGHGHPPSHVTAYIDDAGNIMEGICWYVGRVVGLPHTQSNGDLFAALPGLTVSSADAFDAHKNCTSKIKVALGTRRHMITSV